METINKANKCCKRYYGYKLHKEMHEHYKSLFKASAGELRFEKARADSLLREVREIVAMTNDPLAKRVAEMAIERYHMDSMIHSRLIFGNK